MNTEDINKEILRLKQLKKINNPKVGLLLLCITKFKEKHYYLGGRCTIRMSDGKLKDIRVYVGTLSNFPDGIKNKTALAIAQQKIEKRLKEKFFNGEFY